MALPALGLTLGGVITSALTVFVATKIPSVLASLGLAIGVYSGLSVFVSYATAEIGGAFNVGPVSIYGTSVDVLGLLGSAGVFAAINIIISGYVALVAIKATKVTVQGLKS